MMYETSFLVFVLSCISFRVLASDELLIDLIAQPESVENENILLDVNDTQPLNDSTLINDELTNATVATAGLNASNESCESESDETRSPSILESLLGLLSLLDPSVSKATPDVGKFASNIDNSSNATQIPFNQTGNASGQLNDSNLIGSYPTNSAVRNIAQCSVNASGVCKNETINFDDNDNTNRSISLPTQDASESTQDSKNNGASQASDEELPLTENGSPSKEHSSKNTGEDNEIPNTDGALDSLSKNFDEQQRKVTESEPLEYPSTSMPSVNVSALPTNSDDNQNSNKKENQKDKKNDVISSLMPNSDRDSTNGNEDAPQRKSDEDESGKTPSESLLKTKTSNLPQTPETQDKDSESDSKHQKQPIDKQSQESSSDSSGEKASPNYTDSEKTGEKKNSSKDKKMITNKDKDLSKYESKDFYDDEEQSLSNNDLEKQQPVSKNDKENSNTNKSNGDEEISKDKKYEQDSDEKSSTQKSKGDEQISKDKYEQDSDVKDGQIQESSQDPVDYSTDDESIPASTPSYSDKSKESNLSEDSNNEKSEYESPISTTKTEGDSSPQSSKSENNSDEQSSKNLYANSSAQESLEKEESQLYAS